MSLAWPILLYWVECQRAARALCSIARRASSPAVPPGACAMAQSSRC
jgi:hypothetical protein